MGFGSPLSFICIILNEDAEIKDLRVTVQDNKRIYFGNECTASPGSVYLTGIVDVGNNALSVSVLWFAFHFDDFDCVPNFALVRNCLLNLFLFIVAIPLIFIVAIPRAAAKFNDISIFKAATKVFAMLLNDSFAVY